MTLEAQCPRCPAPVTVSGSDVLCPTHERMVPLWRTRDPSYESFAEHLVLVVAEADVTQLDDAVLGRAHAATSCRTRAVAGSGVVTAGSVPRRPTARASGER